MLIPSDGPSVSEEKACSVLFFEIPPRIGSGRSGSRACADPLRNLFPSQDAILKDSENASPLQCFVALHDVGKILLKNAKELVLKTSHLIRAEELRAAISDEIQGIGQSIRDPSLWSVLEKKMKACLSGISKLPAENEMKVAASELERELCSVAKSAALACFEVTLRESKEMFYGWLHGTGDAQLADLEPADYDLSDHLQALPNIAEHVKVYEATYRNLHRLVAFVCSRLRANVVAASRLTSRRFGPHQPLRTCLAYGFGIPFVFLGWWWVGWVVSDLICDRRTGSPASIVDV